jgi:hypothetical protein
MAKWFRCKHCHQYKEETIRSKSKQHYCSSPACQRARKNQWEREKLRKDESYKNKRQQAKRDWRINKPCDQYQRLYRGSHLGYEQSNREKQNMRNKKRHETKNNKVTGKIVKTDALIHERLVTTGLYTILPYKKGIYDKKIVKTDALIVEIKALQGLQGKMISKTE